VPRRLPSPTPPCGCWAIDEALLDAVAAGGVAVLRLYAWNEATVSIGYFQRETPEIERGGMFHGLPAVRRLSGGGAILHQHELTYSCCIPAGHPLADEPTRLYEGMHAGIQQVLAQLGVSVEPRGVVEGDEKPFLCFARGDRRDLVCRGFKVVGSAQRRRGRAVLQHGSILLRRSHFAPQFPGLLDLCEREFDVAELRRRLAVHCGRLLGEEAVTGELTPGELAEADRLCVEKYQALMPAVSAEA
jgi:lipoate-protein ligase A